MEFVQINVQGTIETKRSRDGRDNLGNESIQIGEAGRRDAQVLLADIIDCLVINLAYWSSESVHSENNAIGHHE